MGYISQGKVVTGIEVVEHGDAWMAEPRGDAGFPVEPPHRVGIPAPARADQLDHDLPAEPPVEPPQSVPMPLDAIGAASS